MTRAQMTRRGFLVSAPLALAACGAAESVWAPQSAVDRVRYRHPGPPMLSLFTMRSRSSGSGEHTGLMINASERVLFDPAGTFAGQGIIERNDVIFGMTPQIEQYYTSYHSRITYFVTRQDAVVPAEVAEQALRAVQAYGAVPKTQCARAVSAVLAQLPGFGYIRSTLFPGALARQFEKYPGVTTQEFYEDDADDKSQARAAWDQTVAAAPAP